MPNATDYYDGYAPERTGPARSAAAIVPNDAIDLTVATRGIYVGSAGNLTVLMADGVGNVTFPNVPAGTTLAVQAVRVMANGTTAANLTGMW